VVLYAFLGITWWPALLIGAGTSAVAVAAGQGRDKHSMPALRDRRRPTPAHPGRALKLHAGDAHRELGRTITTHLRKERAQYMIMGGARARPGVTQPGDRELNAVSASAGPVKFEGQA
jgi:hypothetical protein